MRKKSIGNGEQGYEKNEDDRKKKENLKISTKKKQRGGKEKKHKFRHKARKK